MAIYQEYYPALRAWREKVQALKKDYMSLPKPLQRAFRERMLETTECGDMLTPVGALSEIAGACLGFIEGDEEGENDAD